MEYDVLDFTYESALFLCEASAPVQESFLTKLVNGVQKLYESIVSWIQNFFATKFTDQKAKEVNEHLEKNPSLKQKKIKVHDYDKMNKVRAEVAKGIAEAKTIDQVNAQMKKYRKQRNKILGATALITVVAGTVFYKLLSQKDAAIKDLQKSNQGLQRKVNKYRKIVNKQKAVAKKKIADRDEIIRKKDEEIDMLKANSTARRTKVRIKSAGFKYHKAVDDKIVDPISTASTVAAAKISANVETIKDGMNDIKNNTKEMEEAILNPKNGIVKKVGAVVSGITKNVQTVTTTARNAVSARETEKNMSDKTLQLIEKAQKIRRSAAKVLKDKNANPDKRKKASEALKRANEILEQYHVQ